MRPLTKTTIIIWSDPVITNTKEFEIEELAYEATQGSSYCSMKEDKHIENPTTDPHWDGTEFFNKEGLP